MSRLTLIWGLLLLTGIFKVDIYVESSMSAPVQSTSPKAPETSSKSIQSSPNTTSHATSNTTTHATSNTTHATSNTTTHAPSNTTSHTTSHATSNTTTHAPSNTTQTPSNTTSHSPSNTTAHPITHTTPILPTKPSPPISGNYTVKDANGTCIIAGMGLELELDNSTKTKQYFNVNPKETHANGSCGESRANLLLNFPEGSINFVFVKENKVYYIDEVSVSFFRSSAEQWSGTARKLKLLSTDIGYFAKCTNTPTVKLTNNLRLTMADVKLQAFDIKKGVLGKEKVCYADRNKLLVPVGVALAVVGLILIILLVFLLTRRRRSSGYERI